ncbi:MAG TPA: copper resistance protein CopC [Solirubrobacteraceae bacterium]
MTRRRWLAAVVVAATAALALPGAASAHAYLVKTVPAASGVLNTAPTTVSLTYDEAVEPRFAIISVTSASGTQVTTGPVQRSPADPDTLVVPLRPQLPEGWYLIYWRAISVDGHPVQGAFTYAIGPNPGPAPQFAIPSIGGSATSPQPLIARTIMFLSVMVSIGLFVLRVIVARPMVRRVERTRLRPLSVAFVISSVIALAAIAVYLDVATALDSLRSSFDVGALVPLFRVTAFGRGYVDMLACFALFCGAGWTALYLDRADRERRSVAELAAQTGAVIAAVAVLVIPGASGHAAQTSPAGVTLSADWLHLIAGSLWLGGLLGLLVLWRSLPADRRVRALSVVVPRFSKLALGSVAMLAVTGIVEAIDHMPTLDALWQTGYGVAILVKAGILLAAMAVAAGNLLATTPGLVAARADLARGAGAAARLRRLVGGEAVLVGGAVFVAALLSSLAPPPPAFALQDQALAHVGPGQVVKTVTLGGYRLSVLVSPNKAAAPDSFSLRVMRNGQPVRHADITLTFNQTDMQMPQQEYQMAETQPGLYSRSAPALVMVGDWSLAFAITPPSGPAFSALFLDKADG